MGLISNVWTSAPLRLKKEIWFPVEPHVIFQWLSEPAKMCQLFTWMHGIETEQHHASGVSNVFGVGSRRTCHFGNGMVLEEIIVGWNPPRWYAYRGLNENHPFGMSGHLGVIECHSCANGRHANGTLLLWRHFFDHPNPTAMVKQLDESVNMALDNLRRLCSASQTTE